MKDKVNQKFNKINEIDDDLLIKKKEENCLENKKQKYEKIIDLDYIFNDKNFKNNQEILINTKKIKTCQKIKNLNQNIESPKTNAIKIMNREKSFKEENYNSLVFDANIFLESLNNTSKPPINVFDNKREFRKKKTDNYFSSNMDIKKKKKME